MTQLVHVAVGVVVNTAGQILIAKRPLNAHQGGLWEFPGGKVDAGETVEQALARELREELVIQVLASDPLIQIRHHYPDKSVLLDVYKVTRYSGTPIGNEHQPIQWVDSKTLKDFEFPAANLPIISAINLPDRYSITGAYSDTADLVARLTSLLAKDLRIVQLRVENFRVEQFKSLFAAACETVDRAGATLVINCSLSEFSKIVRSYPDKNVGLHLNRHHALGVTTRPVAPHVLFGISCHNIEEILHAQKIGADYILLSPVLPTNSHPAAEPLGWNLFATLVELANIPVYALGGVGEAHLNVARSCGAQGVAGISAWW